MAGVGQPPNCWHHQLPLATYPMPIWEYAELRMLIRWPFEFIQALNTLDTDP